MAVEAAKTGHGVSWWAELPDVSDRFDAATVTEGLSDLIAPRIPAPLLRREAQIAADVVVRHLNKPNSIELAERSAKAVERLVATVDRIAERHTADDDSGTTAAHALCHALQGRWADAAAEVEAEVGTQPLLRVFVAALRLEQFDEALTVRLLRAGQNPGTAVQAGRVVGKHGWWPNWLLKIVNDRAMAGTLDEDTINALDNCAYAELSPAQSKIASRLLNGDEALIDTSAQRLEALGDPGAAEKLRAGDLTAVALAARALPL
ncbi:hypothetical protein [Paractinoplanes rishiriensis]|uniref:Uncharacterized protein n=1 Tax=Paractinoplanes rishiriensis TaxID=1050105 RepID=A0A919KCU6_9ACTN|nr:hypothetical protein [Actinoplanes rishiriensis]GIF01412.1 hypothetical protein Ari01nite_88760 [Actinoplanes rishiriensis]